MSVLASFVPGHEASKCASVSSISNERSLEARLHDSNFSKNPIFLQSCMTNLEQKKKKNPGFDGWVISSLNTTWRKGTLSQMELRARMV